MNKHVPIAFTDILKTSFFPFFFFYEVSLLILVIFYSPPVKSISNHLVSYLLRYVYIIFYFSDKTYIIRICYSKKKMKKSFHQLLLAHKHFWHWTMTQQYIYIYIWTCLYTFIFFSITLIPCYTSTTSDFNCFNSSFLLPGMRSVHVALLYTCF